VIARIVVLNQMKYDQMMGNAARLAGEEYKRSSPGDRALHPE
jgi:hypothetical protein